MSFEESPYVRWGAIAILVAIALACLAGLTDSYYQFAFEADASNTVQMAQAFGEVWSRRALPDPFGNVPYFDGQYWIYAAFYVAAQAAKEIGALDPVRFPSSESLAILAVRMGNLMAHVGAVVLAFLAMLRLGRSVALALLLALVLLLDPQVVWIDMLRIDRVILFLFVLVFTLSLAVAQGRRGLVLDVCMGVAAAGLASTKITSVVFLAVPAYAYYHRRGAAGEWRHAGTFLASVLVAFALINIRFLTHGVNRPDLLRLSFEEKFSAVASWSSVILREPYLYYNWDSFLPLGYVFLGMFLAALVICIFGWVRRHDAEAAMILLPLALITLAGIPALKHSRAGYVLTPLYLFAIVYGARVLREALAAGRMPWLRDRPWLVGLAVAMALFWPLRNEWLIYEGARLEVARRGETIMVTRVAPRDWFIRHVPPKSRVAIFLHSAWADPPIFDLDYDFTPTVLAFPYLDPKKMGEFRPPSVEALPQMADVIVSNDFHKSTYVHFMRKFGHPEVAREWERFFDDLARRYPRHQFKAKHRAYSVSEVEIFVLNPGIR